MLGVVLMLVAACLNALASVLQRRVTREQPESAAFSLGMILDLLRRPLWLLGILALSAGNLVASQPGFTLTNPLVSVAWGLAVFGEHGRGGFFLVGTLMGAGLIGVGTMMLARSDLLDPDATHEHDDAADEGAAGEQARPRAEPAPS
ncbi:hypothetical protein ACFQE5_07940 [Pseudonocardia hispaniensis]|uniref:Uncharacterized protein n=1 Tax=Pseudonocardia hispaniensis TaxID=904933 RepID=A0ABW1J039_9PSEU